MKNITKALRKGDLVVGTCCDISDPSVVEIVGRCGWDFVIINAEGGTVSPFGAELENMIRAAYAVDVTPVVKIPENNAAMIATCVKLGAKAVEVPKITTGEDARRAVDAAKYPPLGGRMTCWGVHATRYGEQGWAEHIAEANDEITILAVLEEQAAYEEHMDDILDVEGLEVVLIGWYDLELRIGGVGDPKVAKQMNEYRRKLYTRAREKNVAILQFVADPEALTEAAAMGAGGFFFAQDDMTMLRNASTHWATELKKAIKQCQASR